MGMLDERLSLLFKESSLNPAYKALILFVPVSLHLFVPQLSKGVNDDTENYVQRDNVDENEEHQVKAPSSIEVSVRGVIGVNGHRVCDPASVS